MSKRRPRLQNFNRLEERERWTCVLRGQLLAHGIATPELQEEFRFHPTRMFRFDFALPAMKISAEVEGGIWIQNKRPGTHGRHTGGEGYELDCLKYSLAAIEGWMVIRSTSNMILRGEAVQLVLQAIAARKAATA